MLKLNYKHKKAFTLIELLIVIAIIGILFIVLISKVDFASDKAKATGVQTDFRSFQLAFDTVAKENAGFNTFGWDTGDTNANGKRDSYDEGDNGAGGGIAHNGIQDGTEVFTGHKVYAETFTKVFSLKKNGTGSYDRDALNRLETAINANLDPKLHITIKDDGEIVMANGAQDPWNKEYHGYYISNAETDGKDRGAIVMYSDGANNEFGSAHAIANGVVSVTIPNNNKYGKDDYSIVSIYSYVNGYGEVLNITTGFSNNQDLLANGSAPTLVPGGTDDNNEQTPEGGNGDDIGNNESVSPGPGGYQMLDAPTEITAAQTVSFRSEGDIQLFQEVKLDGEVLSRNFYDVYPGSTRIVIPGSYLETLNNGEHTIEIISKDGGSAKTTFTVDIECRNHTNYDSWNHCDYCGIVYCYNTSCSTNDGDCFCDYCGYTSITFVEWNNYHSNANNDCYCDYCYAGKYHEPDDYGHYVHGVCKQCNEKYCDECGGIMDLDECICGGCGYPGYLGIHTDFNHDGVCDACNNFNCSESGFHKDLDGDCRCDSNVWGWECGEVIHVLENTCCCSQCFEFLGHNDYDQNGYCDTCNEMIWCELGGPCYDPDEDCYCNICSQYLHIDSNKNGYCDNCLCAWCWDGGPCVDDDITCTCDSCGNSMTHIDKDDGYCDNCLYPIGCEGGGPCLAVGNNCWCSGCWKEMHVDNNGDGNCDKCSKFDCQDGLLCRDTNGDHTCDDCRKSIHADNDKNCQCDTCYQYMHNVDQNCFCKNCQDICHIDTNTDSFCDHCNIFWCEGGGGCKDIDGDCYCDCGCPLHIDYDVQDGYCDICKAIWCNGNREFCQDLNGDGFCDSCWTYVN